MGKEFREDMITTSDRNSKKQLRTILLLLLLMGGIAYVYFALSPSHYSFFLKNHMGQYDYETIVGEAKGIRSDEWGVVTPYFQIAVNNDYQRFNQDSPYKEDLRFFYGLPLKDWALAFKPYMWGFFTLSDARGFSFYHFFMIASFIIGYTIFLMQLGLPLLYSSIIALTLFFSHHNQVWWTTNAPVFALTIWIIIPFLTNWHLGLKFVATFLISAAALFALIYPPWQISMIYLIGFFALAFRPERFRLGNLIVCFMGFALATGMCLYYLADIVPLLQNTVYPGDRSFNGGSIVSGSNMPEIGTVSSIFLLCLLAFGDYKAFFQVIRKNLFKTSVLAVLGMILFSWMYLPVPNTLGQFMLLDQIEPKRLLLASGTYSIWLVAILAFYTQWKLSWGRVVLFCLLVCLGSYLFRQDIGSIDYLDMSVIAPIVFILVLKLIQSFRKSKLSTQHRLAYLFASLALLYNIIAFGGFNPLQSAHDIFSVSEEPKAVALKDYIEQSNLEGIGIPMHTAASASALSIATYNHVLLIPQLDFFREKFHELDDITFNTIFNRYMHVVLNPDIDEPKLVQADYVELPMDLLLETVPAVTDAISGSNSSNTSIYSMSYDWETATTLNVKFRSPVPINQEEFSVIASEGTITQATLQPLLLFREYFSGVIASPQDAVEWDLNLNFSKDVTGNFEAINIKIGNDIYNLVLSESDIVQTFEAKQENAYPVNGVIDVAKYDAENATLSLTGWALIDDLTDVELSEQVLRWFGYDTDLDLDFQTYIIQPRPDVAKLYGQEQTLSGFHMVFSVNSPPSGQDDLEFCFFSQTKEIGTYQLFINTETLPLACSLQ